MSQLADYTVTVFLKSTASKYSSHKSHYVQETIVQGYLEKKNQVYIAISYLKRQQDNLFSKTPCWKHHLLGQPSCKQSDFLFLPYSWKSWPESTWCFLASKKNSQKSTPHRSGFSRSEAGFQEAGFQRSRTYEGNNNGYDIFGQYRVV